MLISAPDLRQLIRSHVLEQTVKTVETKSQPTNQVDPASTGPKTGFGTVTTHPLKLPPLARARQSGKRRRQLNKLRGTEMAEMSLSGTIHYDNPKRH